MKDYDDDADDYDTSLQPGQHMMNTQMDYKEKYHDALDAYREAVKAIDKLKGASDIDFERADQINALEDQNNALEKEVLDLEKRNSALAADNVFLRDQQKNTQIAFDALKDKHEKFLGQTAALVLSKLGKALADGLDKHAFSATELAHIASAGGTPLSIDRTKAMITKYIRDTVQTLTGITI